MSRLLHISDTHFGTEQAPVVDALAALAQRLRPDVVVLSGDITQRARPRQFQAARAFVNRLQAPWVAIPGNHDIALWNLAERMVRPYADFKAAFGNTLEPVFDTSAWLVLGVNTTRAWRHVHGEVSAAQIQRVAERLQQAQPQQLRVVVVHQPAAVVDPRDQHNLLHGHEKALPAWAAAGADLVLGGHIHKPYVSAQPQLARPLWVVQAGTAVSSRVRLGMPNSVNVVHWAGARLAAPGPSECAIEQWDFDAESGRFGRVNATVVHPQRTAS